MKLFTVIADMNKLNQQYGTTSRDENISAICFILR